jgi:hypothetical protein
MRTRAAHTFATRAARAKARAAEAAAAAAGGGATTAAAAAAREAAAREAAARAASSFALLAPALARDIELAIVDACWSMWHATGSRAALERVLDIATAYAAEGFLEEFGPAPVLA